MTEQEVDSIQGEPILEQHTDLTSPKIEKSTKHLPYIYGGLFEFDAGYIIDTLNRLRKEDLTSTEVSQDSIQIFSDSEIPPEIKP